MTILVLKANYCDDWGSPIGNLHMSSQDLPKHSSRTAASCCCWLLSCRMRFLRGPVKPWNRETVKPTKKAGVKPHLGGKSDRKNGGLMASQCVSVFVHVFSPTKNGGLRKQMRGLLKELQWAEVGRTPKWWTLGSSHTWMVCHAGLQWGIFRASQKIEYDKLLQIDYISLHIITLPITKEKSYMLIH